MISKKLGRQKIASGIARLDDLLGGLFIGDNVVWYDDSGSLASTFCLNFVQVSENEKKPIIYTSFDRSPRNLLQRLGRLAFYPGLTILDCFTWGKGSGSDVFSRFYYESSSEWPCRIIRVDEPKNMNHFIDVLYGIHAELEGDVRLVFESLTGMQEVWGGEDEIVQFYSHSCPRLYELNTVAYWIMEKQAHSTRVRAQINQIAQVAIELSIRRGATSLTILKAEARDIENLQNPNPYWTRDHEVFFENEKKSPNRIELGVRLRELRVKKGISQADLAKMVGVTPSTISQVESNLIYPSLPALFKMAEVLSVDVGSFFHSGHANTRKIIFQASHAVETELPSPDASSVNAKLLIPIDFSSRGEPYLLEIPSHSKIPSHFFVHKGEEMGYLLSGRLEVTINRVQYKLTSGDTIYLTSEIPSQWNNPGRSVARLLWIKIS
jgi:transcriptional regulator with XRE-family HTH domain/KaiC/GvpD/RAD55 family RecA-like ATPase